MSSSLSAPTTQTTNNVCQTVECRETAKSILAYVDFNVDPCSDFYQYTCGSWLKNATLPPDEFMIGPYIDAINRVAEVIRGILEGEYKDLYTNLKDGDAGFHTEDEQESDRKNFQTMKDYYNTCMDTEAIDALGPTPLYPGISNIQNKLFPANQNETYSSDKIDQLTEVLVYLTRGIKDTLVGAAVYNDFKDSDKNVIHLAAPTLTLKSKQTYDSAETIQQYSANLVELLNITIGEPGCEDCGPKRRQMSQNVGLQLWSKEKIQSATTNFIHVETAIANISATVADSRDPLSMSNPVSLADFQRNHSLIDWENLFKGLVYQGTPLPDTIINGASAYYDGLNQLLSSGIQMTTLQDYFVISYITQLAYSLDANTRAANIKLKALITGNTVEKPRWRTCTDQASTLFDAAIGRYYVLRTFGAEAERNKTEVFVNTLHDSWRNRIPATQWLDEETRNKAVEKLNMIKHKVAYSTKVPDVRSPDSIAERFGGIKPNTSSYFDTEVQQNTFVKALSWKQLGNPVDKDVWLSPPQEVNAFYFPNNNEIVVPTGFLQPLFYSNDYPEYLNYGSVGYIIGHEFSHGFDSMGRLYDGNGNLVDWWTNTTTAEFVNRSQCFIDQYSKFNMTGPGGKTYPVDGKLTLAENIADNGGIAASLFAYRNFRENHTQEEPRLPGIEQLSPDQLFFVNFARTWCQVQTDELNLLSIYTDPHSVAGPRVNGVVQNSDEFSNAFNCPAGSPMNPETKCRLW
ncbi:zincin [Backusella circina FSU 941]|nr:zincin [Backusella circina FSU 941]